MCVHATNSLQGPWFVNCNHTSQPVSERSVTTEDRCDNDSAFPPNSKKSDLRQQNSQRAAHHCSGSTREPMAIVPASNPPAHRIRRLFSAYPWSILLSSGLYALHHCMLGPYLPKVCKIHRSNYGVAQRRQNKHCKVEVLLWWLGGDLCLIAPLEPRLIIVASIY